MLCRFILILLFSIGSLSANYSVIVSDAEEKAETFLKVEKNENRLEFSQCLVRDFGNCEPLGEISFKALQKISEQMSSARFFNDAHSITAIVVSLGALVSPYLIEGIDSPGMIQALGAVCGISLYALSPHANMTALPKNMRKLVDSIEYCEYSSQRLQIKDYHSLVAHLKVYYLLDRANETRNERL